jgi:hypothetical protein
MWQNPHKIRMTVGEFRPFRGIIWDTFRGPRHSLKRLEMKLRPLNFTRSDRNRKIFGTVINYNIQVLFVHKNLQLYSMKVWHNYLNYMIMNYILNKKTCNKGIFFYL